jgi:hypothetical protein
MPDEPQDPVATAIQNIDISKVSVEDIAKDLVDNCRYFAFRMMVASTLLERILQKPSENMNTFKPTVEPAEPIPQDFAPDSPFQHPSVQSPIVVPAPVEPAPAPVDVAPQDPATAV